MLDRVAIAAVAPPAGLSTALSGSPPHRQGTSAPQLSRVRGDRYLLGSSWVLSGSTMIQSSSVQLGNRRRAVVFNDGETADRGEAAFAADLRAASDAAFRLSRSLGLSPEDAADVLQDASIRAWRHRATRRGAFRPWFLTITYREARRPRRRWLTVPTSWSTAHTAPPVENLRPDVLTSLQTLPARQRVALSLRYDADLSVAGVATVMGISEPAAKQLLARARASLRHALSVSTGEPS